MRITYAILAREIRTSKGGAHDVTAVFESLTFGSYPGKIPLAALVRVGFEPDEAGKLYNLTAVLFTPKGEKLLEAGRIGRQLPTPKKGAAPGDIIAMEFPNVPIPEPGSYTMEFFLDGEKSAEASFFTWKR